MENNYLENWLHDFFSGDKCHASREDIRALLNDAVKGAAVVTAQVAELRNEAVDALATALPYIEEAAQDPAYKGEHVQALANRIRRIVEAA